MSIAEGLQGLAVPIDTLDLDPGNVRVHDDRNIRVITKSLERFGQRVPLVVRRETGHVLAGNARLLAARALGWTEVAAIFVEDDDATATAFAIVDNRSSDLSTFDKKSLAEVIAALHTSDLPLEDIGFDDKEVEALIDSLEMELEGETGTKGEEDTGGEVVQIGIWRDFTKQEQKIVRKELQGATASGLASPQELSDWVKSVVTSALAEGVKRHGEEGQA